MLTLHRPSNVDDPAMLERLFEAIGVVAREVPLLWPVHPRTRRALAASPSVQRLVTDGHVRLLEPQGYLEFLGLLAASRVALTDSGGVQEETTVLGVPCLTLRTSTERPVTMTDGTNQLVGIEPARIIEGWRRIQSGAQRTGVPALWDGAAAGRIVDILMRHAEISLASPVLSH
jgi:UDP-N-acetylglucosamine 2-epimerase (non-hydrolysing)